MRNRQRGITLMGLIAAAFVLVFAALLAMKLVPSYIEFFAVKKALAGIGNDTRNKSMTVSEIRRLFENRSTIDDINSVRSSELEVTKEGNGYLVTAAYRKEIPLFGNIGIFIDFTASSKD